ALGLLGLMVSAQVCLTASEYWLGYWSGLDPDVQSSKRHYLYIYVGIVAGTVCLTISRAVTSFLVLLGGALELHNGAFKGVLYASMRFFESNPTGYLFSFFFFFFGTDYNKKQTFLFPNICIFVHVSNCFTLIVHPVLVIDSAGRILNRFSKDQWVVDEMLPYVTYDAIQS
ncbi:hypothetical protein RFI_00630, partial [Reticulomyxa filosa]